MKTLIHVTPTTMSLDKAVTLAATMNEGEDEGWRYEVHPMNYGMKNDGTIERRARIDIYDEEGIFVGQL